ncbi:MAG: DNA alkylation repair protein [Candidatus Woesearchaeota archaeon]
MINEIKQDLRKLANSDKIADYQRFFKTGKGQYGEGDVFIGLTVPNNRIVAKKYANASDVDLRQLLSSKIHDERLCALLILVDQFKKGDERKRKAIVDFYLENTKHINNWDLVDLSACRILGTYLLDKGKDERKILYELVRSKDLWEKRIAIISTLAFIAKNQFTDTFKISEILLNDTHDLIHKAVGWMLREIGKKDQAVEEEFLQKHYKTMPRTMLRYAIEKFEEKKRLSYLKK